MNNKKRLIKHLLTYWYIILMIIVGLPLSIIYYDRLTFMGITMVSFWLIWMIGYSIWKYRRYVKNVEKEPINKEVGES